jgi:uncharacterized protein (UPF0305 family)
MVGKSKKRAASPEVFHVGSCSFVPERKNKHLSDSVFRFAEVITKARVVSTSSDEDDDGDDDMDKKDKKGKSKAKQKTKPSAKWVRQGLFLFV